MDNQIALENYAIELNFTKSLTCRLIKLNELDRDKSRWSFSIGRRLRHSDNFTMPRLLSSMRALQLECECNVFESFSFTNSPAFCVLLFSLWCSNTRNHIHCLITSRTDCFSLIPVVQHTYNENLIKHRTHEKPLSRYTHFNSYIVTKFSFLRSCAPTRYHLHFVNTFLSLHIPALNRNLQKIIMICIHLDNLEDIFIDTSWLTINDYENIKIVII